jgi:hypothetical protein
VTHERLGDQFVHSSEVTLAEGTFLPTFDDRHGVGCSRVIKGHEEQYRRVDGRPCERPPDGSAP